MKWNWIRIKIRHMEKMWEMLHNWKFNIIYTDSHTTSHSHTNYDALSLPSPYFLSLKSKYSTQHPVLRHHNLCSFLNVEDQIPHPYKTTAKNYKIAGPVFYIFILYILKQQMRRQ
jgi:hypothetical protein